MSDVKKVTHNRQSDIAVERELRDIVTVLNELVEKLAVPPATSLPSDLGNQSIQVISVGNNQYSVAVRSKDGFTYALPGIFQKVNSIPSLGSDNQVAVIKGGQAQWANVSTVGAVTNVTGTAPVVSSGGATPAISMPKATSLVDGYLSHIDWATFNAKLDATSVPGIRKGTTSITANVQATITYSTPLSGTVDVIIISNKDSSGADVEITLSTITVASFKADCPVDSTLKWMVVQDI